MLGHIATGFFGNSPQSNCRVRTPNNNTAWPISGRIGGRLVDCCAQVEGIASELSKIENLANGLQSEQIA
jgi:hypothetical protein